MKTLFNQTIQPLRRCVSTRDLSFWRSLRRWLSDLGKRYSDAPVYRALAGVLTASSRATSNNRTYTALILLFVVAPFSDVTYTLFDKSAPIITWYEGQHWFDYQGNRVEGWYYGKFYWLFFQIGPHIQMVVLLMAAFLLMPVVDNSGKQDQRRWLLAIAAGYPFAKILWDIQVSNDTEIRELFTLPFLLGGVLLGLGWLKVFDYLMSLHFHKRMSKITTAKGALDCPSIPDAEAREIASRQLGLFINLQ